jgi:uncharacterized protein YkwD
VLAVVSPLSSFAEKSDLQKTIEALNARVAGRRPASPRPSVPAATAPAEHQSIVEAMNRERTSRGLRPLRLNSQLSRAAEDRVGDMLAKHYFDHVSPDGVEPFVWATRRGYEYRMIAENLALGYRGASGIVDGWMSSPGHRQNILTRDFDEVGIAVADTSPRRGYRGPLVVALYGTR